MKSCFLKCFGLYAVSMLLILFAVSRAGAQANRATITGTVTDSTGAVVPGVSVTAINLGTNVATKSVSNGDGIYVVPNLFPGQYSVTFERSGFDTLRHQAITLISTEVARIDAVMKVGSVSTTVTVTGKGPLLDKDTASVGTNMQASVVQDLPLDVYGGGRFVEDFAVAITPGYSVISSPYGAVVNGGQWFTKDYTLDGTSGTSNIRGDSMDGGPSMEAVQEVQATTSGLDAESAITGGGLMAFNLKSGTNALHGSAFLYGDNELLDANTWTNDYYGFPKAEQRAWDYGFSLGGPVHKNRTFFFGTFERYQSTDFNLNSGGATVPIPAFLQGNFSALLGPSLCTEGGTVGTCASFNGAGTPIMVQNDAGQPIQAQQGMIYDPATGDQFTGNIIPAGSISPVAKKVNAFYANYQPENGSLTDNERTLLANTPSQTPTWYVVKLDHVLTQRDHLSGSWIYDHKPRTLDDGGGVWEAGTTTGGPLSNARIQKYTQQQWRLSESHTFGPNVLNVLNFTDAYDDNGSAPANPGDWNSQTGFGSTGANTFPEISFSDNSILGADSETYIGNTWQGDVGGAVITTGDTVTWSKGRHSLTFGGDFVAHEVDSRSGSGAYTFNFIWNPTSCGSQWACAGAGYDGFGFATEELGLVNSATDTVPYNLYGRQKNIDLFAQDSYKMTPKLTVNLGLRWTYNTRFHEKNGNWANFDPTAVDPQLASVYGANLPGSLVFAKSSSDSFEKDEYWKNFGPTLGIAWQLEPKVVFRASYGIIFNPVGVTFFNGVPDGFAPQLGSNSARNFSWDGANGAGVYPGVFTKATLATDPSTMYPFPVEVDPQALRLGYSEAFNIGVQQELTPNTRLEISYVGNRGHHLTDTSLAWNETNPNTFFSLVNANPGMNAYNDYACYAPAYGVNLPYPNFCAPALAATAPLPQMAAAEVAYWYYPNLTYIGLPLGQSFYDSMVVDVVKRTGAGLTMDMSYDWSRTEGDSYTAEQDQGNSFYTGVENFQDMHAAAHGLSGYDLANVVKGFVSYQLPFGRGQHWLSDASPVVRQVVGGWTLAGVVDYYTGQPFAVGAYNPYWPLWGDIYPQFTLGNYRGPSNPRHYVPVGSSGIVPPQDFYMPTTVAVTPAIGYLPPEPNTSRLRCPGQANENATLLRNEPVGHEKKYVLSFRADFYNLLNRHYYYIQGCAGSTSAIGSSNFGEINGVLENPRTGQFAIRLDF